MLTKNDLKKIDELFDKRISPINKRLNKMESKMATKRSQKMMENRIINRINYLADDTDERFNDHEKRIVKLEAKAQY